MEVGNKLFKIYSFLFCSLFFTLTILCFAGSSVSASDLHFGLGVESSYVWWDRTLFEATGIMYGPRISFGIANWNLSGRYLIGDFETESDHATISRHDTDLAMTYSILQRLSLFICYKQLSYDFMYDVSKQIESISGYGIGIGTSLRLGQTNVFFSGAGAYMPFYSIDRTLRFMNQDSHSTEEATGWSLDCSLGYAFMKLPITGSIGFRHQDISDSESNDLQSNQFSSIWLGITYFL